MKHGPFNVKPAELGLKSTDQTWYLKRWLLLKFGGRKTRRDGSRQTQTLDVAVNSHV